MIVVVSVAVDVVIAIVDVVAVVVMFDAIVDDFSSNNSKNSIVKSRKLQDYKKNQGPNAT